MLKILATFYFQVYNVASDEWRVASSEKREAAMIVKLTNKMFFLQVLY